MKFLCVSCDEGMRLDTTVGPHEGSLEVIFVCPRCQHRVTMLTNPWETQLVQTLGVKVGGRSVPASPYEQVLGSLVRSDAESQGVGSDDSTGAVCPFAGMVGQTPEVESVAGMLWTDAAKVRIERIPSFIRPMVQRAIERYALEQCQNRITEALMDEARSRLGM